MVVVVVVVRNVVRAANVIVVGVLYLNVCFVVGVVVVLVLVDMWWWWQGWLDITGDGGIMVVVMVMVMVIGFLKRHQKAKISLCLYGWYSVVVKISFRCCHTLTVGDSAFNHRLCQDILGDTTSQRASKSHH